MAMSAVTPPFFTDPLYLAYREIKADRKETVYAYMNERLVTVTNVESFSKEQDSLAEKLRQLTSRSVEKPITLHKIRKAIYATDFFKKNFPLVMMEFFCREKIEYFPRGIQVLMKENDINDAFRNIAELKSIFDKVERELKGSLRFKCRGLFAVARFYIVKLLDLPDCSTYTACHEEFKGLLASLHDDKISFVKEVGHADYVALLTSIQMFMEKQVREDRWCEYDHEMGRLTGGKPLERDPRVIGILANIDKVKRDYIQRAADNIVRKVYSEDASENFNKSFIEGVVDKYHADMCVLMARLNSDVKKISGEEKCVCNKRMYDVWNYLSSDSPYEDGQKIYVFCCKLAREKQLIEQGAASLKGKEKIRLMRQAKERVQVSYQEKSKGEPVEHDWCQILMESVFEKLVSEYGVLVTAELQE